MADGNIETSQIDALDNHHSNQPSEVMGQKCTSVKEDLHDEGDNSGYTKTENRDSTHVEDEDNSEPNNGGGLPESSVVELSCEALQNSSKIPDRNSENLVEMNDADEQPSASAAGGKKGISKRSRKKESGKSMEVDQQEDVEQSTPENTSKTDEISDHGAKRKLFKRNLRVRTTNNEDDDETMGGDNGERTSDLEYNEGTKTSKEKDESDSSSCDDEDDIDEQENEGNNNKEGNYEIEEKLLTKPYPKLQWHSLLSEQKRQLGGFKHRQLYQNQVIGNPHFVQKFERYAELKYHQGCVNTLHFNQGGSRLASGSDDLKIAIWDWARKKTVLTYDSGHRRNVFQAKFMPNSADTTIVSCARDGQVRVGELSSTGVCKDTKRVVQHKLPAHKLALEPGSPVIFLSCGEDAKTYSIDLRDPKPAKILTVKEEEKDVALYTIFINPSNINEFTVGGRDPFVRVYDRRKLTDSSDEGTPLKKLCPHHLMEGEPKPSITCSVYSYDGQEILVSYNDDDIYLFDNNHSDGADYIHRYQGHRNNATVKGVNFYGPESEFVVSGSDCGNIFLWSKDTERIITCMPGDDGGVVNCLEPHPSFPVLATSGLDHDIKVWLPTSQEGTSMEGVKETMHANRRSREDEHGREPDQFESQLFMYLLHQLRRSTRRQAREEGDELDSDDSSDSDDEDSDDEDEMSQHVRCAPS